MADWPIILVRFLVYVALAILFGLSAFGLYGFKAGKLSIVLPIGRWLVASALSGLLLSFFWVTLMASAMAGTPVWSIDQAAISALLTGSAIGTAWKIRMVALVTATIAVLLVKDRRLCLGATALASGVAVVTLSWTGHGAMDDGAVGWTHLAADILHLLAASAWVGALVGLILLVWRPAERVDATHLDLTHRALHGFGSVGTLVVGTIVVTGLVNSWLLVGPANIAALGTTLYGLLLLAKLALFATMLGLAALNRFRLTPALERSMAADDHIGALVSLRRSLLAETLCVITILALVAWLGTLAPPGSAM